MQKIVKRIKRLLVNNDMTIIVWFIGAFSSGKTTQARMICEKFSKQPVIVNKKIVGKIKLKGSFFEEVSNIGVVNERACSGADTIGDKTSRSISLGYCARRSNIILIDGALFSNTWWNMILKNSDKVLVVHLHHFDLEDNKTFLKKRRAESTGRTLDLADKTIKHLEEKNKGALRTYERADEFMRNKDRKIQVSAVLPKEEINMIILKELYKMIKEL